MNGSPRKTIFIDRNSGGQTLRELVTKANIHFVLHDDIFNRTTDDHVWLKKIGNLGYAMVTGDIAVEKSYLFLSTLIRSTAQVFILRGLNHALRESRAQCIIDAYPKIVELCNSHQGPRLWKTDYAHKFQPVDFKHIRGILRRYGRTDR